MGFDVGISNPCRNQTYLLTVKEVLGEFVIEGNEKHGYRKYSFHIFRNFFLVQCQCDVVRVNRSFVDT